MQVRVYYEDTDAGGVVYHTKYIAFCERARSEVFFKHSIKFDKDGFVVRDINATFYSPAKLGDLLDIKTKIDSVQRSFVNLTQSIYKEDILLFEAKIRLVFLKDWKIASIPKEYIDILEEI